LVTKRTSCFGYKKDVVLWYDAFTSHDPALLDRILGKTWVDIPSAPGQPSGPRAAKDTLALLTTAFPDLKVTIDDILQDGALLHELKTSTAFPYSPSGIRRSGPRPACRVWPSD